MRNEQVQPMVLLCGVLQEAKYLTSAGVLGLLGVGGWKTTGLRTASSKLPSGAGAVIGVSRPS